MNSMTRTLCAIAVGLSASCMSSAERTSGRIEGRSLVLTDDEGAPYLEAGISNGRSMLTLQAEGKLAVSIQAGAAGSSVALHNGDGNKVASLGVQGSVACLSLHDKSGADAVVLRVDETGRTITMFDPRRRLAIAMISIEDATSIRLGGDDKGALVDLQTSEMGASAIFTSGMNMPLLTLHASGAEDAAMTVVSAKGEPRVRVGMMRDSVVGTTGM